MSLFKPDPSRATRPIVPSFAPWSGSWRAILLLVLGLTVLRVAYLVFMCPFDLVEDESHYWEWSRHLGWSYYSKGPGIAYAIAAGTSLFGTHEWSVRLPGVVGAAIASLAVAAIAADAFKDKRAGFFAAACFNCAPIFIATSMMASIDMPYIACWSVAAWAGWVAVEHRKPSWWLLAGAAIGVGFLFKYTALLLAPGLILYAVLRRRIGGDAAPERSGAAHVGWGVLGVAVMVACMTPVIVWNIQNDWPTFRHLLGHLKVEGGDVPATQGVGGWRYTPLWTLEYLGTQFGFGGPMLLASAWASHHVLRRGQRPQTRPGAWFTILCAAPIFVFYFVVSFATKPQGNWAAGAYPTLAALAGAGVASGMDYFNWLLAEWRALPEPRPRGGYLRKRPETFGQVAWDLTLMVGVVGALVVGRADLFARLPGLGGLMPIHRVQDGYERAEAVTGLLTQLSGETGKEPFVMTNHYGIASRLSFYLPGRPGVRCVSSRMAGRKNQYDFWPELSPDDPALMGRPAVLISGTEEQWRFAFERVVPLGKLLPTDKDGRETYLGYGYKGFR